MSMLDFTPFIEHLAILLRPVVANAINEDFADHIDTFCKMYSLEETATNLKIALAKVGHDNK